MFVHSRGVINRLDHLTISDEFRMPKTRAEFLGNFTGDNSNIVKTLHVTIPKETNTLNKTSKLFVIIKTLNWQHRKFTRSIHGLQINRFEPFPGIRKITVAFPNGETNS